MKLPPDIEFLEEIPLLIYRPHGVLDEASLNKLVEVIDELEALHKDPFNRFWDATGYDDVTLNFKGVMNVSLYRRLAYSDRPSIKVAVLATERRVIQYGRLLALLTQGSPIKLRVFQQRREAAEWLGVTFDLLMPKAAPESKT